jgi:hypothetical protein
VVPLRVERFWFAVRGVQVLWVTCIGEFGGAYTLGAETDRSLVEPGAEIAETPANLALAADG